MGCREGRRQWAEARLPLEQRPWELGLQEVCPSQTAAHPSPAPVLLQALLGRLTLEWDSGVHW